MTHSTLRRLNLGLSMIELMVAMTISAVLIFGATEVYVRSRATYSVNEAIARLQETARYAMSVIEPDVRMAGYWGLSKVNFAVTGAAAQGAALSPVAAGAGANSCGVNFAVDLENRVQGDDNAYILSPTRQPGCDALPTPIGGIWTSRPVVTADTLTARRASTAGVAGGVVPTAGQLQICSERDKGWLFSNGALTPCPAAPTAMLSNVIVNAYYVDRDSGQNDAAIVNNVPSLRRKSLGSAGGAIQFVDQEIIPGIEDLQVQFGLNPNYGADPYGASNNTGSATRYVDADVAQAAVAAGTAQLVSVRVWLLVRADAPEVGFEDTRIYEYGDRLQANGTTGDLNAGGGAGRAFQPSLNADNSPTGIKRFRRILISRTIQLRNAMGT